MNGYMKLLGMFVLVAGSASAGSVGAVYFRLGPNVAIPSIPPASETAVRTVGWFREHAAERNQLYAACMDNPGAGMIDPDCQNAIEAKRQNDIAEVLASMPNGGR
jgi:hypothetical protein